MASPYTDSILKALYESVKPKRCLTRAQTCFKHLSKPSTSPNLWVPYLRKGSTEPNLQLWRTSGSSGLEGVPECRHSQPGHMSLHCFERCVGTDVWRAVESAKPCQRRVLMAAEVGKTCVRFGFWTASIVLASKPQTHSGAWCSDHCEPRSTIVYLV